MLSHEPVHDPADARDAGDPLGLLKRVFPEFERQISGKDVLDFGCGAGLQSIAMAQSGARFVLGLDTNPRTLARAKDLSARQGLGDRLAFAETLDESLLGRFDIVISQNSMEHFADPVGIIELMKTALKPEGRILVTFGPPWLSPYGSHMWFFTRVPWVNVLFSESAVMKVRSRFICDGATRYEDVEGGLNRMTVAKFESIVSHCGLEVSDQRYDCVRGLSLLAKLPGARELFINHVSCALRQAQHNPLGSE